MLTVPSKLAVAREETMCSALQ